MNIDIIEARMSELQIGQRELARKSGIPLTTVHNIVSGKTPNPRIMVVAALANALTLSIDDMIDKKLTNR